MAAVSQLNQNAELYRRDQALLMNLNASHSLSDILKTNLGPAGTLKMLVGGAGDVQLTKDGNVLLKNLTIIHPTAIMISRTAIAQDDSCGDGTTSSIVLIDGILKVLDHDINRLGVVLDEMAAIAGDSVRVTVTVSADEAMLPHNVKKYL